MRSTHLKALALAVATVLAMPVWADSDLNLDGSIDDLTTSSFVSGSQQFAIGQLPLSSVDLPIELNQGDIVRATVVLDSPFTVPASPNQFLILDFGQGASPPSYDIAGDAVSSGSMAFFLGGNFLFSTGSGCSNCVDLTAGFFPGQAYTFDSIEATLNIDNLTSPYTVDSSNVVLRYQLSQPVPEPGSWALLFGGLGFGSLWMRRRRAAAAEAVVH